MSKRILSLPIVLYSGVLLVLALVLYQTKTDIVLTSKAEPDEQGSRSLLHQTRINRYDSNGVLNYTLQSAKLWHFTQSGNMELRDMYLSYHPELGTGIKVTAEQGVVEKATNRIYLKDNIEVKRPASETQSEQILTTRNVVVETDNKLAHTDQKVMLREGKHKTVGMGMTADLNKSVIKLHSKTKVWYEP